MPKRTDIKSILILGAGPIVIGQACEFDYSGTQACRVLRAEGIRVILVNSNPATIMTDPMNADHVYLLPLTAESIEKISDNLKYLLNSTTFYKDKKHHLFVTQENDPNFLLDTLVVNFGELLSGQTYFIENANKEVAQTPNVSVYCGKAFENYKHIVESY